MKKRILFVDDDAFLLAGLRRLLRSCRSEWDMEFVGGGEEAIKRMKEKAFDVIVSDMRMPGMDGAQLLSAVRADFPDAVRIILSGQSAQEVVFRSVGPAHQFLSKPCSGDKLKLAIIRACNVSSWIGDESVLNLMRQVEPIQELPQPITELIHMLQDHEAKPHEVASLIESDPQLSECLMSLVRFIHASGDEKIVDVKAAAELLGVDQLRPLILAAFGYVKFGAGCVELEAEMKHSLRVAQAARTIARFESDDSELADQAMMAGVMHRIGGLLVSQHFPESYQAIRDAAELLSDRADVERKVLSTSTAQIGGFVLCNWGLPTAVVEAVGFQDCPADATLKQFSPMIALYLARHLIDDMNGQTSEDQLDLGVLNEFGVEPRINEWKAAINESLVAIG